MIRTAILTVSDSAAAGSRDDGAVHGLRELLEHGPFKEVDYDCVPDEQARIRARLRLWCDGPDVDLVLTCGGTGLSKRDRTPEATREVIEREVPGLPERMRHLGAQQNPLAYLSRGVAGVRRATLVVNLPGSTRGASDSLRALLPLLPHAVDVLTGEGHAAPNAWHG